jgi:nicotinamidase-related amidase
LIDLATDAGVLPMRRIRLIIYDMRVGVVSQIAAGAEVTGRVREVLESARRAGIRVFFTRHCCCRTRPPVRPRWSARRFVAIGASHA